MRTAFGTALALLLAASARSQVRVEVAAPRIEPASVAAAPSGIAASLAVPAPALLPAPSLRFSLNAAAAPAAASLAAPLPATALPVPVAAAPQITAAAAVAMPAPESKITMDDWYSRRWSLPRSKEGAAWRFRDYLIAGTRLWDGSQNARELGSGIMGTVFVHPTRPDAVVKVARRGYADATGDFMGSDDETALDREDHALTLLAEIGAAPRPLERLTISGRPASARERIYGSTLAELKRARLFGAREHALVHDLLDRIAEGGFIAHDLHFENIMIGRRGGDQRERAWVVDTLGVSTARDPLGAAGRKAHMLAAEVVWLAFKGIGFAKPLGRLLDGALHRDRPLLPDGQGALPWSKPRRYATLTVLLGALAFLPPLVHAALPSAPSALGILPSWTALAQAGVALALAGIPVRIFAHRLAPWMSRRSKDQGLAIVRESPASAVPALAIAALIEEFFFRGIAFLGGAALLLHVLPPLTAFAAASFASSLIFALTHSYGSVWTRVVGGMIYAGALLATGSLLLPIAAHLAFNLSLYIWGRYLRP